MPIHDWSRVDAGIFHAFHHGWIEELSRALNRGPRDPEGMNAAVWEEISGQICAPTVGKPLSLGAYESGLTVRTYTRPVAVGDRLPDMPLFLEPDAYVEVPLETTYDAAFAGMPRRWQRVLDPAIPNR